MDYKSLSYRQKNKLLWIGGLLLLVLCWFLSFAKTAYELRDHQPLSQKLRMPDQDMRRSHGLKRKQERLDSLVTKFARDSVAFEDHFLQNVSVRIDGLPVQLIYDGTTGTLGTGKILAKNIILKGEYVEIVDAIAQLEREFFVRSVRYEKERYLIELAMVAK